MTSTRSATAAPCESAGGFDESLTRLVDWDLIARYTAVSDPVPVPSVAGRYFESEPDSISAGENFGRNWYLIQRKHERPIRQPLRVLYVVANYPQLTETYIRWEITRMQRWGVHVDVWSPTNRVGAPYDPEVPGHFGPLEEAIEQTRPHVAHIHWLHFATSVRDTLAHRGIPITVRGHGYDFNPALLRQLAKDPAIQSVYVFPHFARQVPPHPKIKATPVAVCGDLYYPEPKDRRLVVRAGTTKRAKDLEMMVDVALRCREHRFLLIGSTPIGLESDRDHLLRYNEERGNPVEIRLNVPTEETAAIIRRAGIYLHTYGETEPFGMSVSIGEAMATGALTLVRNRPGAREYIGDAGRLYGSAEEAANIIWATAKFSPREWAEIERKAVDRAYLEFADCKVLRPILDQWLQQSEVRLDWTAMPGFDDDMELKRWIPVLLQRMQADRRGFHDNSYLAHLLGMYRYLKSWGWDPDVCLGSLFHSIYLPGHPFWPLEARDEVRALIGRRAEQIAYLHSAHRIDQFAAAVERGEPFEVEDRFTKRMTPMTCEEFREFAALMLADWLENVIRHPEEMNWQTSFIHVATMLGGAALESTGMVLRILNQPPALNPSHELQRAA